MATYGIQFNSVDLETGTPGFKILSKDVHSIPTPTLEQYALTRLNGMKFVNVNYQDRKIVITGVINGNDLGNAEQNLDTLKNLLRGPDKNLDIPYANSTRRFVATMTNLIIPSSIGSFLPISIEFTCSQSIGQDLTTTSQTISTITTTPNTQAITIGGSFTAFPLITLTLNSGTGLTAQPMTITNPATGIAITITRTWLAGDVVVIDCLNQTVTVNAVAVDATGMWPSWDTGAGNFKYTDGFTARNVTTSFVYNKMYL